jgi:hypothetical protein
MAEQRELEVTIISAQDLKNVTTFGKQSPFAVVWIHPSRKMTTPVATRGGVNPSWNAVVKVLCEQRLIDQGNGVMTIEILNKGSISNTQIGSVTVPKPTQTNQNTCHFRYRPAARLSFTHSTQISRKCRTLLDVLCANCERSWRINVCRFEDHQGRSKVC